MNTRPSVLSITTYLKSTNWKLLIFLLLFLNVKLIVKLLALLIIYLLQPNFRFGFKLTHSRLPLFYPAVIFIAFFNFIICKGFTDPNQTVVFLTGVCFWLACILAIHQLKLFTAETDPNVLYRTIIVFFILNALFSFAEIFRIILETGSLNPYRYQGNYQKYFISTGDYIKGITLNTSVTNAALNAFGIIFFLFRKNFLMVLLCMCVLLLTASNLTNLMLFAVLIFVFAFQTIREQKSIIAICFFLCIVFLAKVSPQNNQYLSETYKKITNQKTTSVKPADKLPLQAMPDSLLTKEKRKEKTALLYLDSLNKVLQDKARSGNTPAYIPVSYTDNRPVIPEPDIHSKPFQNRNDTNQTRGELLAFIHQNGLAVQDKTTLPGKVMAFQQTFSFLMNHPAKLLPGNGMARFSSKLAFKATGLGLAGNFPKRFTYIHPAFLNHHLALYLSYFSDQAKLHSVINSPNSVYVQLLGEYGFLGVIPFAVFYIGYFLKYRTDRGYALPLLLLLLGFFFTDYWFEQLSIVLIFELFMFLNKPELVFEND